MVRYQNQDLCFHAVGIAECTIIVDFFIPPTIPQIVPQIVPQIFPLIKGPLAIPSSLWKSSSAIHCLEEILLS